MESPNSLSYLISIHAPHTRSDKIVSDKDDNVIISIHAPHTRSDTASARMSSASRRISIHAPHTRSDLTQAKRDAVEADFNPRPSYEERLLLPFRAAS